MNTIQILNAINTAATLEQLQQAENALLNWFDDTESLEYDDRISDAITAHLCRAMPDVDDDDVIDEAWTTLYERHQEALHNTALRLETALDARRVVLEEEYYEEEEEDYEEE